MMLRVGLTGGIACGKSVVLAHLGARGLPTLDLDRVAHEIMAPGGTAYEDVVEAFGPEILDGAGSIDRQALGAKVFGDPEARARLDAMVHPRVREEEGRRAAAMEAEGRELLVSDAALLVEAGVHLRFDRLVVVHCTPEQQRVRLMARSSLSEEEARARIAAQMPIGEKRLFAHLEVDTSGSLETTAQVADILAGALLTEARGPRPTVALVTERALGALAWGRGRGPRGLEAGALLESATAAGGLELRRLAARLEPPAQGAWYRSARPSEGEPWPEALAAPLALWALARRLDEEWLAGAAATLARLTHGTPDAVAGMVQAALASYHVARDGSLRALEDRSGDREDRARRWAGGEQPARRVRRAHDAALAHGEDPASASEAARVEGAEPAYAGALVAMVKRGIARGVAPELEALVETLCG